MMKNLLLSILMLSGIAASAQLFVRPNPSTSSDSYVYVNDVELFVTDDVNLERNSAGPTEASIYLRNDGQLLQGSGSTDNDGDGMLSVYQTVDETSAFHYNYWHSPVGLPSGPAGNRRAGISRIYDCDGCTSTTTAANQTGVDPGFNGKSDASPATISPRWIYRRLSSAPNEAEANYQHIAATNNIPTGYGFTMKGVSPASSPAQTISYTYDFRGRPNNGTISVPVNMGAVQWTLVGNPYPSALDLKAFYYDNGVGNIQEIRFWDEPRNSEYSHYYADNTGGYGTWTPGGPDPANPDGLYTQASFQRYDASGQYGGTTGTGSYVYRRYSPIGQGFVVETSGSDNDVTFTNSQRVFRRYGASNGSEFQRIADENGAVITDNSTNIDAISDDNTAHEVSYYDTRSPQIRMNVMFDEDYSRELLLVFDDQTTDGYDWGWDGSHPMDAPAGDAYFLVGPDYDRDPFVINAMPFDYMKMIPLGISISQQRQVTITNVEDIKMTGKTAYIYDNQQNTYRKFDDDNVVSMILPAGTYDNRFFVVFRGTDSLVTNGASETANRTDIVEENVNFFQNNRARQLEISNPEGYNIKDAVVFDMSGKLVYSESNIGNKSFFTFPTGDLSDGVYLVKLTTDENINITYKSSIINK